MSTDANLYKMLIEDERIDKMHKFSQHHDRQLCLGAGLLLAHIVKLSDSKASLPVEICYGEFGKPELKGAKDFHFNISHSAHWVVCAVASKPVGVDIEKVQHDMSDVARHYFSLTERDYLASLLSLIHISEPTRPY